MDVIHLVEANRQGSGVHAQVLKARAIRRRVEMNLDLRQTASPCPASPRRFAAGDHLDISLVLR